MGGDATCDIKARAKLVQLYSVGQNQTQFSNFLSKLSTPNDHFLPRFFSFPPAWIYRDSKWDLSPPVARDTSHLLTRRYETVPFLSHVSGQ